MFFLVKNKNYTVLSISFSYLNIFEEKTVKEENTTDFHVFVFVCEIGSTGKPEFTYIEKYQVCCPISYSYIRTSKMQGNAWEAVHCFF